MTKKKPEYSFDLLEDGISQSQIKNYLKCRRYFYLSLIRGWAEEILSKSIVLGICFHRCCELWYGNLDEPIELDDVAEYVLEEYAAENDYGSWSRVERQDYEEVAARLVPIFPAYAKWWSKKDAEFKWDELEHVFKVPLEITLRNGDVVEVPITGMVDGLITRDSKNRRVFETKTKGRVNMGGITNTVLHDFQVNMYLWASNKMRKKKQRYNGFIYNLVHTSNLRQTKSGPAGLRERIQDDLDKNPHKYFNRIEDTISVKQEKEFEKHLRAIVTEIANFILLDGGKCDNRFSPQCLTPYGQCEFLGVCYHGNASGLKRRKNPHPELVDGHA